MIKLDNILYDPKKFIFASVALLFLIPTALVASLSLKTNAISLDSTRDCDDNAILRCGALTPAELADKYQSSGMGPVYARFGISAADITNMESKAVEGVVTNNNNVWIKRSSGMCPAIDESSLSAQNKQAVQNNPNLCLVATNAVTAGRQNIAGSTQESSGGITFFQRPPSVSFASSSLSAFVVMDGGRFSFAIIASCGNPVIATPVVTAAPKPAPAPAPKTTPTPTPTPSPSPQPTPPTSQTTINNNNTNNNTNNNSVVVQAAAVPAPQTTTTTQASTPAAQTVVAASTPAPAQPAAAPSSTPTALPNTGPGPIAAISGLSTVFGTAGHLIYQRRKLR